MSTTEMNTLLGRCHLAYLESFGEGLLDDPDRAVRLGVAGLLQHIAAEVLVVEQCRPAMAAYDVARMLIDAAKEATP